MDGSLRDGIAVFHVNGASIRTRNITDSAVVGTRNTVNGAVVGTSNTVNGAIAGQETQ